MGAMANDTAAMVEGPAGGAAVLLVCEHASNHFPAAWGDLGLDETARASHIAWDPGALALTRALAARLAAPLVAGTVSRLIYDCNRPPEAPDAIPAASEIYPVPGNQGLSAAARAARVEAVYRPFVMTVEAQIAQRRPAAIVTVHSFTPLWFGRPRSVQLGLLHDADSRLADSMLAEDWPGLDVRRNQPYGPADGVTHSLKLYGVSRGLANVMIEVRNDLLADATGVERIAAVLAPALASAIQPVKEAS
jgi:predicted N-formylglutamate amidohydrolase